MKMTEKEHKEYILAYGGTSIKEFRKNLKKIIQKRKDKYGIINQCFKCKHKCKMPNIPGLQFKCYIFSPKGDNNE